MSWLSFFNDQYNASLMADLINRERDRNEVLPPFHITALDTPPAEIDTVVIGDVGNSPTGGDVTFDLAGPLDKLWYRVVYCMAAHLAEQPKPRMFVAVGLYAVTLVRELPTGHHTVLLLPDSTNLSSKVRALSSI